MRQSSSNIRSTPRAAKSVQFDRSFILIGVFVLIGIVLVSRLFVLQIIKHDQYERTARQEQVKKLELPAERGSLYILDGEEPLQVAANETKYMILADPAFIKDPGASSGQLAGVLGIAAQDINTKLRRPTRYEIIAKKVSKDMKDAVMRLDIRGIVYKELRVRTYPQGPIAPHVLGFVNEDGFGQYGVEGALQTTLAGTPGQIKAVTDIYGTPLLINDDNIVRPSVAGKDVVLSIDQLMQRIADEQIKAGVERTGAKGGSVIIMESHSGRVKAMANYPTYSNADYAAVVNPALYQNRVVSEPLEPGSIMKTLTVSAALDLGIINTESTYNDTGSVTIDGITTRNALEFGVGITSIFDILKNSLNTGAVHLLQQMGGGEINQKARDTWYDYLDKKYGLGEKTGIEQEEEARGIVPLPDEKSGINIQYANSAFGQGVSVSLVQMAAAVSSVTNGGIYYQPTVVYGIKQVDGTVAVQQPNAKRSTVSRPASDGIVSLMQRYASTNNIDATRAGFVTGGKTGTAQVPKADGGYREDVFNATFAGFVGTERPEYTVIIRLDEGPAAGNNFTGGKSARPVFTALANQLMDSVSLAPRVP